ncbi:MAG: ATP-binding cassette domain-containing protein [Propionibacteriaceae bacterium]|nr:ATP-binding cassette domain-containing protein [Propionibacteriaceae bacterium]
MTISVKNVSKSSGDVVGLRDVAFTATDGQIVAIVGPRASGKSCLITCLAGLTTPDTGMVMIDEQSIHETDARQRIGVVLTQPSLDDELTVNENITLYASLYGLTDAARQSMMEVLTAELDLDPCLDRRVSELSIGQKRLADIARALIHAPQVVLLDEPFAGLEPREADLVWHTLLTCQSLSMTVIFTADEPTRAKLADRVGLLVEGQLVALGGPNELIVANCPPTLRLTLDDPRAAQEDLASIGLDAPEPEANGDVVWVIESPSLARDIVSVLGDHVVAFDYHTGSLADVMDMAVGTQPGPGADSGPVGFAGQSDDAGRIHDITTVSTVEDSAQAGEIAEMDDDTANDQPETGVWTDGLDDETDTTGVISFSDEDLADAALDGEATWEAEAMPEPDPRLDEVDPANDGARDDTAWEQDEYTEMLDQPATSAMDGAPTPAEPMDPESEARAPLASGDSVDPAEEPTFMDETMTEVEDVIDIRDPADTAPPGSLQAPAPQPVASDPTSLDPAPMNPTRAGAQAYPDDDDQTYPTNDDQTYPANEDQTYPSHDDQFVSSDEADGWHTDDEWDAEPWAHARSFSDTGRSVDTRRPWTDDSRVASEFAEFVGADEVYEDMPVPARAPSAGDVRFEPSEDSATSQPWSDDEDLSAPDDMEPDASDISSGQDRSSAAPIQDAGRSRSTANPAAPTGPATPTGRTAPAAPTTLIGSPTPVSPTAPAVPTGSTLPNNLTQPDLRRRLAQLIGEPPNPTPPAAAFEAEPTVIEEPRSLRKAPITEPDPHPTSSDHPRQYATATTYDEPTAMSRPIDQSDQFAGGDESFWQASPDDTVEQTDMTGPRTATIPDATSYAGQWSEQIEQPLTANEPTDPSGSTTADDTDFLSATDSDSLSGHGTDSPSADDTDSLSTYDHAESPYWSDPAGGQASGARSVLLPPLFDENVELGQLAAVSQLVKDAILKDALPSFDEQFPPGSLPITPEDDLGEKLDADDTQREALWRAELSRPVDETLAHQARIKLAVEKRIREARRRRDAQVKDGE